MNPTSQSPEQKFPFGSDPNAINNKTLKNTLIASTALAFTLTLVVYMVRSDNSPLARVPFGVLVTVLPGLGAYVVLRLTNVFISRRGAIFVYVALVLLAVIIQAFARLIPVAG